MISVIIPSIRDTTLNERCLKQQTFRDFELIITRPIGEKPKDLFYTLNRDMNRAFRQAKGELIVSYQDLIQISPDCLERFWYHYQKNKKICIGAVGDQYSSLNPPIKVWEDPRKTNRFGSFYEINPIDLEFTLCAIPRQAILSVKGLKEKWDYYAAVSEKEMCVRIDRAGYKSYLDQSISYKAISHPRLKGEDVWNKAYKEGSKYFTECINNINNGIDLEGDL